MATLAVNEIPRLWRTVRHLRPSQVGWRLRYLVQRRLEAMRWYDLLGRVERRMESLSTEAAPRLRSPANQTPCTPKWDRLTELRSGRLTLLNEQRPFAGGEDWRVSGDPNRHRLWNFTLHYHGWLRDLAASSAITRNPECLVELRRWLVDWLECCPIGSVARNPFAWNSFNIGERLWHWREIEALVPPSFWHDADLPRDRFLRSVAEQAAYLSRHIEWDLRGNHLFKDAVGLAAAADLLGAAAPPEWMAQATSIAVLQVVEQILPDGMHFERSPMYHIHVLEDLLALRTMLHDDTARRTISDACRKMAEPLRWLTHPQGIIPLFNDAADQQVRRPAEMEAELLHQGIIQPVESPTGLRHFSASGLAAWHGEPWTVFFDLGEVGPDYQPGHAHADSLTLELSFGGRRLVVDPGTSCYDHDERRRYDRSTNAHNTVCIDDANSSEVWHIFRVGRRARPVDVSVMETAKGFTATASHTGYDHLAGSPRHRRRVHLTDDAQLEIHDEITGTGRHRIKGGFLIAPEWTVNTTEHGWTLQHQEKHLRVDLHADQPVETAIAHRPWHPEFGQEIVTQRLAWSGSVTLPFCLKTTWQPTTHTP